jgi:hypothetical protein
MSAPSSKNSTCLGEEINLAKDAEKKGICVQPETFDYCHAANEVKHLRVDPVKGLKDEILRFTQNDDQSQEFRDALQTSWRGLR